MRCSLRRTYVPWMAQSRVEPNRASTGREFPFHFPGLRRGERRGAEMASVRELEVSRNKSAQRLTARGIDGR